MRVELTKRFEFEASHYLTGMQEGHACATEHSHTYGLELTIAAQEFFDGYQMVMLQNGLVVDSGRLKIDVWPVIKRVKGQCLNAITDSAPWALRLAKQPTVEHLAMYFWEACQFLNKGNHFELVRVRVYESPMIWAEVSPAS